MKQDRSHFGVRFVLEFMVLVVSLIVCLLVFMSLALEEEVGYTFLQDLTGVQWRLSTVTVHLSLEDDFVRGSSKGLGRAWRSERPGRHNLPVFWCGCRTSELAAA